MRKDLNKNEQLEFIFENHLISNKEIYNDLEVDLLVDIIDVFRPNDVRVVYDIDLKPIISLLEKNEFYRNELVNYLKHVFYCKDFDSIITDKGIINDTNFFSEILRRTFDKILPYQPSKKTLQYILNQVFYDKNDPIWLNRIPKEDIERLYDLCEFKSFYKEERKNFELAELFYGLEVLVQRITGRALETDVNKMVPEYQNFDSPFIALQREFSELNERLMRTGKKFITPDDLAYKQIILIHKQCKEYVDTAFKNSHKYGISLKVNQSLLRIKQQLNRIEELLPYLILESESENLQKQKTIGLSLKLINYNCGLKNIRKLINESTELLSYEITQHTAQTGEHYITRTRNEYFQMLKSASGGGFIVAFLCVFKVLLSKVNTSEFGHAFLYSMNYSLGFISIYLLSFTLATKQPAMTASALIRAIEEGHKNLAEGVSNKYRNFAIFFARVFRSQFIAFVGNVFMAFPIALFLIWAIDKTLNYNIAEQKWEKLIVDLSPIDSPAIFHSAIAGCFLFISGIIAGSISNRDKHYQVFNRIKENPILKKSFGKTKTEKIAKLYEKKWPGIISNFWFGIFMGSTASVGMFLGLDLDIRHITFASGNLALGLYGHDFQVSISMIIWSIIGIGIIGLVNFLVSFTLSLTLAFRSRNIALVELRLVAIAIWKFFKQRPFHFFFPPSIKN